MRGSKSNANGWLLSSTTFHRPTVTVSSLTDRAVSSRIPRFTQNRAREQSADGVDDDDVAVRPRELHVSAKVGEKRYILRSRSSLERGIFLAPRKFVV